MTQRATPTSLGAIRAFLKKGSCSETLFSVLDTALGHPVTEEEHASLVFAGGILQHGYQCGQIWGAVLAAGAEVYRRLGAGPDAEARAIHVARRLIDAFREQNAHTDCLDFTELDERSSTLKMVTFFLLKGGTIGCMRMAGRYAPLAMKVLEEALSEPLPFPAGDGNCAAAVARKMGASERHAVMVSGLAGGIGLSGGGCGALGAAVWLASLRSLERGDALSFKSADARSVVERYLPAADYEIECRTVVGRAFDGPADHAAHVCQGGCARIIGQLAG